MSLVLGIESSCDDTAVALVRDGREILASTTATQAIHRQFGGVVPELASRDHLRRVLPALRATLEDAEMCLSDVDAIAVTYGPGLVGSLLVGVSFARGLSLALGTPTIAINHLEAHLLVHCLHEDVISWPALGLLVSGGHTELVQMNGVGNYKILGATRDDAAGEAFDKVGKLVGLPFPAGPHIDRLAAQGDPKAIDFPRAWLKPRGNLDFSFSGLKTAVSEYVRKHPVTDENLADLLASFQQAIVDVLVKKTAIAARANNIDRVVIGGGVAANRQLRSSLASALAPNARLVTSPSELCTDNGVMVAVAGELALRSGHAVALDNAVPNLPL